MDGARAFEWEKRYGVRESNSSCPKKYILYFTNCSICKQCSITLYVLTKKAKYFFFLQIDVYSFGIVMWELLTGEDPYSDMRAAEIIGNVQNFVYADCYVWFLIIPSSLFKYFIWCACINFEQLALGL